MEAIAKGVLKVQQDGQTVQYQTMPDLIAGLAVVRGVLYGTSASHRPRVTFARMIPRWGNPRLW